MTRPPTIRLRVLDAVMLGKHLYSVGSIIELGVDAARQLWHQQRVTPLDEADRVRLSDFPRVTGY
jgi:hypothetical protein